MPIKAALFFIGIFLSTLVLGQQLDTTHYSRELSLYTTEAYLDQFDTNLVKEDTSFYENYAIHPLRPSEPVYLDLGPVGTPYLNFNERFEVPTHFSLGYNTLRAYQSDPKKTKYYNSNTPRTLLKYSQGNRDLLYLKAQHSQKLSPLWTFGLDYERVKSNNIYYGNITDFTSVKIPNSFSTKLYTHFHSPNFRYQVIANFYADKNTINETGGITDRVHFDSLQGREKQYFNLAQNSNASNTIKHNGIYIKQYYQLGKFPKPLIVYDSLNKDSIVRIDVLKGKSKGQLYHELQLEKNHLLFEDENPNTSYYPDLLLDYSTLDSVEHNSIANTLGIMLHGKFSPNISVRHAFHRINENGLIKVNFHNISTRAAASLTLGSFELDGNWTTHLWGYNLGDQHLKINAKVKDFGLHFGASQFTPSFVDQYFVSNHFYWFNNWAKSAQQYFQVDYNLADKLGIALIQRNLSNWIIYGSDARPQQLANNVSVSTVRFKGKLALGVWHFDTRLDLNEVSSELLPTPALALRQSIYFEKALFKLSMPTQIGFNFYYSSEFEGMSYHPATRQFFLSPGNNIGNYPLLDVFFSAKVGGLKLFAIIHHVNEGLNGDAYYNAANYPMMPLTFRFGLEWRLFD